VWALFFTVWIRLIFLFFGEQKKTRQIVDKTLELVNLAKTKNKKLRSSKLEEQGRRIKDLVMNYYGMWSSVADGEELWMKQGLKTKFMKCKMAENTDLQTNWTRKLDLKFQKCTNCQNGDSEWRGLPFFPSIKRSWAIRYLGLILTAVCVGHKFWSILQNSGGANYFLFPSCGSKPGMGSYCTPGSPSTLTTK